MPEKIRAVVLEQDPIERQDNVNNVLMTPCSSLWLFITLFQARSGGREGWVHLNQVRFLWLYKYNICCGITTFPWPKRPVAKNTSRPRSAKGSLSSTTRRKISSKRKKYPMWWDTSDSSPLKRRSETPSYPKYHPLLAQIEEDEPLESIKYSKFEPYMLRGTNRNI